MVLDAGESRHAVTVLRAQRNEAVTIFDGAGRVAAGVVVEADKQAVRIRVESVERQPPSTARLLLAVAVPKGSTIEWIIEKAVELGASEILPMLTERTVVRLDTAERATRQAKWERVAIEACKQCGQNWLPRVHAPQRLDQALTLAPPAKFHIPLVACLQPDALPLHETLCPVRPVRPSPDADVDPPQAATRAAIWIGPEGDFSPDEYARLRAAGLQPVSLGPIVLRVETAALYALSVLRYCTAA